MSQATDQLTAPWRSMIDEFVDNQSEHGSAEHARHLRPPRGAVRRTHRRRLVARHSQ